MATISNTPRPGYVYDSTDAVWYPIGTGPHTHADYITSSSAINPTIVDAKGDIIAATAADTVARLAVGANDTVLTADSSTATGLKWATPVSGSMTSLATGTSTGTGFTISSIPGTYKDLVLIIDKFWDTTGTNFLGRLRFNSDTGSNYQNTKISGSSVASTTSVTYAEVISDTVGSNATTYSRVAISIPQYALTNTGKTIFAHGGGAINGSFAYVDHWFGTSAITSITLFLSGGTMTTNCTYELFGVK